MKAENNLPEQIQHSDMFFTLQSGYPKQNADVEVITTSGEKRKAVSYGGGDFYFTDCTHPEQNCYCAASSITGWRYT